MNIKVIVRRLIKEAVFAAPILRKMVVRYYKEKRLGVDIGGDTLKDAIQTAFQVYRGGIQYSPKERDAIIDDIVYCFMRYQAKPYEYFLYGFDKKNHRERSAYMLDIPEESMLIEQEGLDKILFLCNKYAFYNKYKSYFGREACRVVDETDKELFIKFCDKNRRFIAKPLSGSCGRNTFVVDLDTEKANSDAVFEKLISYGCGFIVEQLIVQAGELAQFNPTSVNTVRLPAWLVNGRWKAAYPFIRTGMKGMVVDNGGAGGILASIDAATGIIVTDAYSENGQAFTVHPGSGVAFKGFAIPRWTELLELAEECHRRLPDYRYIAWDFALTDKGWVVVEGNWGQFVGMQMTYKKPLKKEFLNLMNGNW